VRSRNTKRRYGGQEAKPRREITVVGELIMEERRLTLIIRLVAVFIIVATRFLRHDVTSTGIA
jgi:hypothetical protein